jgi:hypothetical protein
VHVTSMLAPSIVHASASRSPEGASAKPWTCASVAPGGSANVGPTPTASPSRTRVAMRSGALAKAKRWPVGSNAIHGQERPSWHASKEEISASFVAP